MTGFTQNYGLARVFGGTTGAAGISRENAQNLPDIFDDVLGSLLPTNIYDAFTISEYMMTTTPPFASVTNRVVRYFLTSIGITGASGANKEKYEKFIRRQLHLLDRLGEIGNDLLVYGNSFVSVYLPFERVLTCPKCGTRYMAKKIDYRFDPRTMTFSGKCYRCGEKVTFNRFDYPSPDQSRICIRRWNPKRFELRVHPVSGKTEYYYRLDEDKLVSHITSGKIVSERACEGHLLRMTVIEVFSVDTVGCDFIRRIRKEKSHGSVLDSGFNNAVFREDCFGLIGRCIRGQIIIMGRLAEKIISDRATDNMRSMPMLFVFFNNDCAIF